MENSNNFSKYENEMYIDKFDNISKRITRSKKKKIIFMQNLIDIKYCTKQYYNEECPICMENNHAKEIMKCNHTMCKLCYSLWKGKNLCCPICRQKL